MDRRAFIASLGALALPYEPKRVYSFGPLVERVTVMPRFTDDEYHIWVRSDFVEQVKALGWRIRAYKVTA